MAESPEALVKGIVRAVNARDLDRLIELTQPDVEFRATIAVAEGREYRGREGFRQFFDDIDETFDQFEIVLLGWEQPCDHTILVELQVRARGRASGLPITQSIWQVWRYRNGIPWRNEAYSTRQAALEAAGVVNGAAK